MEILETRVYRGPNLYALWPMIRLKVDLGELEHYPTIKLPGFADRLLELIPTLAEHTCGLGVPGGFVKRMREDEGTWLGHVMEHIAIELQCLVGTPVSFGKTREDNLPEGQYYVIYSYVEEAVGLEAGRFAMRLIHHLLPPERADHDPAPFDYNVELENLVRLAQRRALGPTTAAVVIDLKTPEQVREAFEKAQDYSSRVLVEACQSGNDYRILVVNGRVVAVAQRVPGHVVGDGQHTVAELVEIINRDPRRGVGHEKVLTRLEIDGQAQRKLEAQGLSPEAVPEPGRMVYLRSTGNLSTGGTAIDKTDSIHYDNRIMAERAVQAIGLDVGGVDFISPDISRSFKDVGGAIVEINAAPGFRMHLAPTEGTPRDVAGPVIDMLFSSGTPCRIPIAAITGTNGKTTTTRMVAHILKLAGYNVGMTTTDGVYIDGVLTVRGDMTGP